MNSSDEIKVSVCVVTYNQENYIRQCLQSIVDQQAGFKFDVIVSDDCSTDGTRAIVQEFSVKYPDIVKPIFHEKNIGAYKNFVFVHQQATGEYIAHVDGDDYCLPGKLQAQADFLDNNKRCNIVWTPVILEMPDGSYKEQNLAVKSKLYTMCFNRGELIKFGAIGVNSSKMYRKSVRDFKIPDFEVMDYFANVEQVGDGVACFSGSVPFGVYRLGVGVASSGAKTRQILGESLVFFHEKYPQHRLEVNTFLLTYFLADLKNRRKTSWMFFKLWVNTFHVSSVFTFIKSLRMINDLR